VGHDVDPTTEKVPFKQTMHVVELIFPVAAEYLPATHGVQLGWPEISWYDPPPHRVQTVAAKPEYDPKAQFWHVLDAPA